jgi:hypothetical protein
MSNEITAAFVMQYRANVIHLAQQKGSKLRAAVRVNTDVVGKADHFDRVGKGTAKKKTSRHADTPLMNTPHSRRRVTMDPYEYADLVDKSDKVRLLISPESEYVIAGANAMGRAMDDVIIAAATGNSVSVDEDEATATVALGAGQQIAHGSAGMTVAKLRQAARILDDADVEEEDRHIVLSPVGFEDLLATTEVTSSDYNTVKALVQGTINSFMGFTFHKSTRLSKSGNIRTGFAWHMAGIGLSIGTDIVTRISERPDKSYAIQVYHCMDIGAVRVEEERVVQIDYDESV